MTFLGPVLIAGMYGLAIWLAINGDEMNEKKSIIVVDETHSFSSNLKDSNKLSFEFTDESVDQVKKDFVESGNDYFLYIPATDSGLAGVQLYSEKQPSISVVSYIEKQIENSLENKKLIANGISRKLLDELNFNISIQTIRFTEKGEENGSTGASYGVGMFASILIYLFIFLYGVQVMRGVIEEKNNRIVEIIISSVRPFQLMMGKIIGIALVGLTQFALWVILTAAISSFIGQKFAGDNTKFEQMQQSVKSTAGDPSANGNEFKQEGMNQILEAVNTINFPLMLGCFVFYFLAGYLLYSALFAAIGSAVDNESETQQFMFPVTIPLIFSFVLSSSVVVNNPDGPIAFWLSLIPLTSPVVMMVRIPFGVPTWQIITSMILLILGFLGTVWMAAKIYRTGILMYGKKVNFKEIGKWLFYKS